MAEAIQPSHLNPSDLGTKEYWDEYYERDLDGAEDGSFDEDGEEGQYGLQGEEGNQILDPIELDSWFDDVGAPAKTLAFLTATSFPLSPKYHQASMSSNGGSHHGPKLRAQAPAVLDLGTGNGSALFTLRLQGKYTGPMVGVDYSSTSIKLAKKLRSQYAVTPPNLVLASPSPKVDDIEFEVFDVINGTLSSQPWLPASDSARDRGFDLVLDKGTFDAISLSSDTVSHPVTGQQQRICEVYPSKVLEMVKPGGFLLLTSCNWTESEVINWFTGANSSSEGGDAEEPASTGMFQLYDTIRYPVFEFGGQKGQGVASVCFRKVCGK